MEFKILGKLLLIAGILLIIAGLFLVSNLKIPWLGKLPGDINIQRDNFHFYFPLTTCIIISIILSFLLWFFTKK